MIADSSDMMGIFCQGGGRWKEPVGITWDLEKEMATHSSVLAWRIPGTGELGGLPSTGSHRVGHNWSDLAAAAGDARGTNPYFQPSQLNIVVVWSLSRVWLWAHGLQHARLPCPSLFPRVCSDSCPLSHWCYLTISSSVALSPIAFSLSQHQGLFQWVKSSHQEAKVLELQLQHQSFQWILRVAFL